MQQILFTYSFFKGLIEVVRVEAMNGSDDPLLRGEGQSSYYGGNPRLLIVLKNGGEYRAELYNKKTAGQKYTIQYKWEPKLISNRDLSAPTET